MPEEMRPASSKQAPNPAHSYERSDPNREAGMGKLDAEKMSPDARPDQPAGTVKNKSQPDRQLNAQETLDARAKNSANPQPDHSMHEEESLDEAPQDIHNPRDQRHPRVGGKGGTPDEGESTRQG
jgi:hypothetical protein